MRKIGFVMPKGIGWSFAISIAANLLTLLIAQKFEILRTLDMVIVLLITICLLVYYEFFRKFDYLGSGQLVSLRNGDFISDGHRICAFKDGKALHIDKPATRDGLRCSIEANIRELSPRTFAKIPIQKSEILEPQTYRDLFCMGVKTCSGCPKSASRS